MLRRRPFGFAFGVLVVAAPLVLQAQGRLRGTAYDSLARRPLAGAIVWLQQFNRTAFTDSSGRFVIDSIPPGRYILGVAHPDLDSAGLPSLAAVVEVRDSGTARTTVAVPSIATLWRRLCGGAHAQSDSGIVVGVVRDVDSGVLLGGVGLEFAWLRLETTDPKHVTLGERSAVASTDSTGSYRVCGVSTDLAVHARAFAGKLSTGVVQWVVGPRPLARRDFALCRVAADSAAGVGAPATLRGRVRGEAEQPVSGARVVVEGADSAISDSNGRFTLSHLPGGTQWLRVRAIGFAPVERAIELRSRDTTMLDLTVRTIVLLDTINATARMSQEMRDFEDRRKVGFGYALRAREILNRTSLEVILRGVPSLFISERSGSFVGLMHSSSVMRGGYCVADVYLDGMRGQWDQLAMYVPADIAAIEVYPRPSLVPTRFQTLSGCGAVLVWTKYLR